MYKNSGQMYICLQLLIISINTLRLKSPTPHSQSQEVPDINIMSICQEADEYKYNYYKQLKTLGKGSFGDVKELNENQVVKIQIVPATVNEKILATVEQVDREIYFLNLVKQQLTNQNKSQQFQNIFLRLIKCEIYYEQQTQNYLYFSIFEKYSSDMQYRIEKQQTKGLTIIKYMRKVNDPSEFTFRLANMTIDLFSQLKFFHDLNLIHGDIKPDNVLVKSKYTLEQLANKQKSQEYYDDEYELIFTLADYGLMNYENVQIKLQNLLFTHPAMQMLKGEDLRAYHQSDIYSMALTVLSICNYEEGYQDALTQVLTLKQFLKQNLDKYTTQKLDEDFFKGFTNLKNDLKNKFKVTTQMSMNDCYTIDCVMVFVVAQDNMNKIPNASKILKYLNMIKQRSIAIYTVNSYIYQQRIDLEDFKFENQQIKSRCNLILDFNYQPISDIQYEILSENCDIKKTTEAEKFKVVVSNDVAENTKEKLIMFSTKIYYYKWLQAVSLFKYYYELFENFINFDYYYYVDIKKIEDSTIGSFFRFVGLNNSSTVEHKLFFYTFFYFDFANAYQSTVQIKIPDEQDDISKFTYNFINLFEGLQHLQDRFLVLQRINPTTIVQTTPIQSVNDLNLKMLVVPIFHANQPFILQNYQEFFTYPLRNFDYYNYQADTYSMSLTCIYIVLKMYKKRKSLNIDQELLFNLNKKNFIQNKISIIQQNIQRVFSQIFTRYIELQNCRSIDQFPDNLLCILMKQVNNNIESIKDPRDIVNELKILHEKIKGPDNRRII